MRRADFDDPDLVLSDLFADWPEAALVFIAGRMLCPGCLIAPFHTITDACEAYALDEEAFRGEVKRRIEGRHHAPACAVERRA